MDQLTIQIAKIVEGNGLVNMNQGLLLGNTGLCILYYHISRQTHNSEYEKLADDMLDKAFSNLATSVPVYFENGLAGIGWGIEYLVQNGFAEGDTDEILEEVDNKVFKALIEENLTSFELGNGLAGYLFYLISRLKDKPVPPSMAQRINKELLILTINKIDELATAQFPTMVKEMQFDLFWRFPIMLYGLTEAFQLNIYNAKISSMVRQWLPYFEAYVPSLNINRLFIAISLARINNIIQDKRIEKQIQILLFATDFNAIESEFDSNYPGIRYGWSGVVWLLYMAKKIIPSHMSGFSAIMDTHDALLVRYQSLIEQYPIPASESLGPISLGISNEIVGIGLLDLLFPEAFRQLKNI